MKNPVCSPGGTPTKFDLSSLCWKWRDASKHNPPHPNDLVRLRPILLNGVSTPPPARVREKAPSSFLFTVVVRPGAPFVASDRSVRSDALCSVHRFLLLVAFSSSFQWVSQNRVFFHFHADVLAQNYLDRSCDPSSHVCNDYVLFHRTQLGVVWALGQ